MTRSVKSAERTLALLELFSARREPLTVGQVTQLLAIPQASASMLLGSLRALGYLGYDRRRRTYAATIRLTLLGGQCDGSSAPGGALHNKLRSLRDRLGVAVFLAVQNEAVAQTAFMLARPGAPSPGVRADHRVLLSHCAAGHALLSCQPECDIVGWAHRCGVEAGVGGRRVAAADLLRAVRRVRTDGYAQSDEEPTFRHGTIAVPMSALAGATSVAVGAGLDRPISDAKRAQIVRELLNVARDNSAASGADMVTGTASIPLMATRVR